MVSGNVKASYGDDGSRCDICQAQIESHQAEYEVRTNSDGRVLLFHYRCHGAWQAECVKRQAGNSEGQLEAARHSKPQR